MNPLQAAIVATIIPPPHFPSLDFDTGYIEVQRQQPSPFSTSTLSDGTVLGDQHTPASSHDSPNSQNSPPPAKRLKAVGAASKLRDTSTMIVNEPGLKPESNNTGNGVATTVVPSRPRRVRTGCLTCRKRHLKCDEGVPDCVNCRKSNRECERGVRLNFIDTQVQNPEIIPPTHDWNVHFQDESREIASEYKGGLGRYAALGPEATAEAEDESQGRASGSLLGAPTMAHQPLPPIHSLPAESTTQYSETSQGLPEPTRDSHHHHSVSSTNSTYSTQTLQAQSQSSYAAHAAPDQTLPPQNETRDYLNSSEETLFMQVFVEEVGLWMDSMDPLKHVWIRSDPIKIVNLTTLVFTTIAISRTQRTNPS